MRYQLLLRDRQRSCEFGFSRFSLALSSCTEAAVISCGQCVSVCLPCGRIGCRTASPGGSPLTDDLVDVSVANLSRKQ